MSKYTGFLRIFLLGAVALTAAVSSFAFEGRVEMKVFNKKEGTEMSLVHFVKGLRVRTKVNSSGSQDGAESLEALTDLKKGEVLILASAQKAYFVHSLPGLNVPGKAGQYPGLPDFKSTGRREIIAGVAADEYAGQADGQRVEVWLSKELGQALLASQGKAGPGKKGGAFPWQKFADSKTFFAMRVVTRAKEGAPEQMRVEVTQIRKGAEPDSLFVLPSDYQLLDLPGVGSLIQGLF